YTNLHTAEFPGGAVRGQLHAVAHAVELDAVLRGGPLGGLLSGDQEVPGPKPAGDPDGHATSFIGVDDNRIRYSFSWSGIGAPTDGHIHAGAVGVNGAVAVPLFSAPNGLPASVSGIAGVVGGVKPDLARQLRRNPNDFYANLHTPEFPGTANMHELDLNATQPGEPRAGLASTVEVLRLITVGGVAPPGICDPHAQPVARVPYQADYVFLAK